MRWQDAPHGLDGQDQPEAQHRREGKHKLRGQRQWAKDNLPQTFRTGEMGEDGEPCWRGMWEVSATGAGLGACRRWRAAAVSR